MLSRRINLGLPTYAKLQLSGILLPVLASSSGPCTLILKKQKKKIKFVLSVIFLVSALVAIAPQQFHQQRTEPRWLTQYYQPPNNFQHNHRQSPASLYYDPDMNIPFFRYSRPNIQPAVIYPQDEEGNERSIFDGNPQYYIDNKQTVQSTNQGSLVFKQVGQDNEEKDLFTIFPYVRPIAATTVFSLADSDESVVGLFASQKLFADRPSKIDSHHKLSHQKENNKMGTIIPVMAQRHMNSQNQMVNVKPRIKNYGLYQDSGSQQKNARLFYLDGSNFLSKTLTVKVTSTCTTISIVSCIEITNLDPSDPPVACRRKRSPEVDYTSIDEDVSQFPINPSKVETVTPTMDPLSVLSRDPIQTPLGDMTSSKEEAVYSDESKNLVSYAEKRQREGKFFKFNIQNFLKYTTETILGAIVTSTLTQTIVPVDALACLPAGYVLCPI